MATGEAILIAYFTRVMAMDVQKCCHEPNIQAHLVTRHYKGSRLIILLLLDPREHNSQMPGQSRQESRPV